MSKPHTLIFRTAGTNCDRELAYAFELAGATTRTVHVNEIIDNPTLIDEADLIGFPGGFSYGDDIASGRIYANLIQHRLREPLWRAAERGTPMIGICNGFQVLTKLGLLPACDEGQSSTLADNTSGRFQCQWETVEAEPDTACVWMKDLARFELPIAHAEGRFLAAEDVIADLEANHQIALRYEGDPNGSSGRIAGVCDASGRILGLMPHPERWVVETQHPSWTREVRQPDGLKMFVNAVQSVS